MLLLMWDRLGRDPYEALGVYPRASASDIRNAFLAATKQFHPARFARMAPDILSLANEVFLKLRATHDSLTAPPVKPVASQPRQTETGASQSMRPAAGPLHPPTVTPQLAVGRHGSAPMTARTGTQPIRPTKTPPLGTRHVAPGPQAGQPEGTEAETIVMLLGRNQLAAAKVALAALAASAPQSKQYRSLLAYAKGREALLDNRFDAAYVNLKEALQIDPDLQPARTALAELLSRRK